jgi:hypothetical protein
VTHCRALALTPNLRLLYVLGWATNLGSALGLVLCALAPAIICVRGRGQCPCSYMFVLGLAAVLGASEGVLYL